MILISNLFISNLKLWFVDFIYTLDIFLYQNNYDSNIFRRFKKKTKPIFVLRKQVGFSVEIVYFELSGSLDGPSITDKGYTSDKSLNLNSIMPIQNSYGVGVRYVKTD